MLLTAPSSKRPKIHSIKYSPAIPPAPLHHSFIIQSLKPLELTPPTTQSFKPPSHTHQRLNLLPAPCQTWSYILPADLQAAGTGYGSTGPSVSILTSPPTSWLWKLWRMVILVLMRVMTRSNWFIRIYILLLLLFKKL